ncbi:MAG: SDR family NAD(P)-dependent oxidoreductase [Clostridia bacterium]|nr:SDR family NAD(P)-dependent oxidoreductase [Clostridia bacterium]
MKSVVVTGADRNLGLELCREFLKRGWHVFAGRFNRELHLLDELKDEYGDLLDIVYMDVSDDASMAEAARSVREKTEVVDMLVHNAAGFGGRAGGDIRRERLDLDGCMAPFNINALGAIRLVQGFLPLMRAGMKRLCFISSEAGSVSVAHRTEISGYCMSKTALNMAVRLMFNQLRPMGFTFRLYHPGWVRSTPDGRPRADHMGKFEPWQSAQAALPQFLEDRKWEDALTLIDNEGAAWPF